MQTDHEEPAKDRGPASPPADHQRSCGQSVEKKEDSLICQAPVESVKGDIERKAYTVVEVEGKHSLIGVVSLEVCGSNQEIAENQEPVTHARQSERA